MTDDVDTFGEGEHDVVLLHGILASARNLRSFGRRLAEAMGDVTVLVPDLRGHGRAGVRPPPHDLDACARDVEGLVASRGRPVRAVIGHSFGGKVALTVGRRGRVRPGSVWSLDTVPWPVHLTKGSTDPDDVGRVLDVIAATPMPMASMGAAQASFESAGLSTAVARWLTTSLRRGETGLTWALDLTTVHALLVSYAKEDLTGWLAEPGTDVHLVVAGRSGRWGQGGRARLDRLAQHPSVTVHVFEEAGHWVHVDAAVPLIDRIARTA